MIYRGSIFRSQQRRHYKNVLNKIVNIHTYDHNWMHLICAIYTVLQSSIEVQILTWVFHGHIWTVVNVKIYDEI